MVAEAACISKPWTIIPMVVTGVQNYIAAGQFRGGEQLVEAQQVLAPGTILTFLEPIYKGGLDGVTPGSSCVVNAYTSNHERIAFKGDRRIQALCVACRRRRWPRARDAVARPGPAASRQDAGAERTLSLRLNVARGNKLATDKAQEALAMSHCTVAE